MAADDLGQLIRRYLQRVVNDKDLSAVDDMVAPDYRASGPGWPSDIDKLRDFYRWEVRDRPDWHVDVQETVEVGDWVAVRAHAGGHISHDDDGRLLDAPYRRNVEWLTAYRVRDGRIVEMHLLSAIVKSEAARA